MGHLTDYAIKHKDDKVAYFIYDDEKDEVKYVAFDTNNTDKLPSILKEMLMNKKDNINYTKGHYIFTTEKVGEFWVKKWLENRAMPVERYNFIKQPDKTNIGWMLSTKALSFSDSYWVVKEEDKVSKWKDCNLYRRTGDIKQYVSINGGKIDINKIKNHMSDATLGGQLDKCWYSDLDGLWLYKETKEDEILSIREKFASEIYKRQNILHADYDLIYHKPTDEVQGVKGCVCKAFTNEKFELVTAVELLQNFALENKADTYNLLIKAGQMQGMDAKEISDFLDSMFIVDYLIMNRDRHANNLGFLRNSDTMEMLCPAPIYDSGGAKCNEDPFTERGLKTEINGLYNTFGDCLDRVRNMNIIDISLLPTREEYMELLNTSAYIPFQRKNQLCIQYNQKIKELAELQKAYSIRSYPSVYNYKTTKSLISVFMKAKTDDRIQVQGFTNSDKDDTTITFYTGNKEKCLTYDFETKTFTGSLGLHDNAIVKEIFDLAGVKDTDKIFKPLIENRELEEEQEEIDEMLELT